MYIYTLVLSILWPFNSIIIAIIFFNLFPYAIFSKPGYMETYISFPLCCNKPPQTQHWNNVDLLPPNSGGHMSKLKLLARRQSFWRLWGRTRPLAFFRVLLSVPPGPWPAFPTSPVHTQASSGHCSWRPASLNEPLWLITWGPVT